MSVLKIKDSKGRWVGIPSIRGEDGTVELHASEHEIGGRDELTPEMIGASRVDHSHTPDEVGAAPKVHTHTPTEVGAVSKSGDTINGNLNVNGALVVERSDNNRKARTVVHNNTDKEADLQNYKDDSNYVGIRLATEEKGAGDVANVVHMKNGHFASFPILHTGNKEKIFTFGSEDLTAGSSSLGHGQLHFVYE